MQPSHAHSPEQAVYHTQGCQKNANLDQRAVSYHIWSWTDLTSSQFLSHFFLLRITDVANNSCVQFMSCHDPHSICCGMLACKNSDAPSEGPSADNTYFAGQVLFLDGLAVFGFHANWERSAGDTPASQRRKTSACQGCAAKTCMRQAAKNRHSVKQFAAMQQCRR